MSQYPLLEAPKIKYEKLATDILRIFSERPTPNYCLIICTSSDTVIIVVYLDDLLVSGPSKAIEKAKVDLAKLLKLISLGICLQFFGIRISKIYDSLLLSQQSNIERIMDKDKINHAKPDLFPLLLAHALYEKLQPILYKEKEEMKNVPYR